jgi:very-short-patch-repair endonuclease
MSVAQARHLRRSATPAEKRLWSRLRNRQLADLKFRRQEPIGDRVVDFYCAEAHLAIELDGSGHTRREANISDLDRELELHEKGIRVLRFFNRAIFANLDGVLNAIIYAADPERSLWGTPIIQGTSDATGRDPHLSPLPQGEETASRDVYIRNDDSREPSALG